MSNRTAAIWGHDNVCLYAMPSKTGEGPAAWCHSLLPDYHARFAALPAATPSPSTTAAHSRIPSTLRRASSKACRAAHGVPPAPQEVFDVILCLLSARSYTLRAAADLEGDFPHVPFTRDPAVMTRAAALGARIRAIETFAARPEPACDTARIATAPGPMTELAGDIEHEAGAIVLGSDGTARVENVPVSVWDFAVSGCALLPRWLKHRRGQRVDAEMLDAIRDLVARIAHLSTLIAGADSILSDALEDPLTRSDFGL